MTDFIFSTDYNYQKTAINKQDTVDIAGSSTGTLTISHDLGYIPSARVWYDPNDDGTWYPLANVQLADTFTNTLNTTGSYYLTTSDIVVSLSNSTVSAVSIPVIVRVYYDD